MLVTRFYPTEKKLGLSNLTLKVSSGGKTYYATKHVHKLISDHPEGIAYKKLFFQEMQNIFQEVTLPLSNHVNNQYQKLRGCLKHLREGEYIETKKEELKDDEYRFYINSYFLHKQLRKESNLKLLTNMG